ncbi:uncharacterized protein LOC124832486 [Vigna umbellata]|uniref:uncharacterized protein LOC124832486 n=1 Tax=Vigna umbellata TaxID=87088 RepID=UPI001F5F54D6|nr:uncharacterized protein LOC124832486 [Vigna umbellata]XP_047162658.1 uncharacterized protein LOC124832486 [Vigna umbellata]
MGEEDESSKNKNIGGAAGAGAGGSRKGAGRPCKRPKPKKVPQRGLGVAQLEKIRLEEEEKEKKAAAAAAAVAGANANANGSSNNSACDLRLQFANFPHCNYPSSSNSMPSSTVSLANSGGGGGSEACWHGGVPPQGRVSGAHLWAHHNFELQSKNLGMDPKLTLASSLPCQSNPLSPSFNWLQRTQQQHPSSSMVSASSGTSSTTVPKSLIEIPSNQSYSGCYVSKRQEERMTGIKRPGSFSLQTPPATSSNFKPLTFPSPVKASETIPCRRGREFNLDFSNSTIREVPSLAASNSELNSKKKKKDNESISGDFLRLAPPIPCSNFKLNSTSAFQPFHHLANMKNQVPPPSGYNQQQQHCYNFIPPSANAALVGQQSDRFQNHNVVARSANLDLTLKL